MQILIINPPHHSIGSRIPKEHLPPLGLLSLGGPLIDDGHKVSLLDAEFGPMSIEQITAQAEARAPDAILLGHSGSTSCHPVIVQLTRELRRVLPTARIIYGGVFPTYHWQDILREEPQIDVIVRGEGEATIVALMAALQKGDPVHEIAGLALRHQGKGMATPPAAMIKDLDAYRVGWELIDLSRYSYWGGKRAVVMQFSRGCPHLCNYCGQRGFWTRWRHRDPVKFAAEIAWLHRRHGVEVINFADENPTVSKKAWRAFLEALIGYDLDLTLVGSTRADDIVRDKDILHLYKKAGFERFLLGMENTDEKTLALIKKGGTTSKDREAIKAMRRAGILSMATWVVGFEEERPRDLWRGFRQLLAYDPDQIQALYITPHRWTPFYRLAASRQVIQLDKKRWDYKHQVLATRHLKPWQLLLCVKLIEALVQSRPKALMRVLFHKDPKLRHAMRWYTKMGRRVWPYELWCFFFRERHVADGPTLVQFWGAPGDGEEQSMASKTNRPMGSPAAEKIRRMPGSGVTVYQSRARAHAIVMAAQDKAGAGGDAHADAQTDADADGIKARRRARARALK